ncbi:MAG: ABC transporter permease [Thermoplasmata archaeon]|nr:ABC transporter permease [Thermoplasmata archaeon]
MNLGARLANVTPTVLAGILSASLLALFLLPLLALAEFATPAGIWKEGGDPQFWTALDATLLASAIAVGVSLLLGVPLGYLLARKNFPGKSLVRSAVLLPVMIPHLVAGLALLLWVAPGTPVSRFASWAGVPLVYSIWAVVLVMVYVGASYTVLASELSFRRTDEETLEAARSLGATPTDAFLDVTLPTASRGILTGAVLTWARGVSEIGAFLILAYAIYPAGPYTGTVTSPISVYIYNLYGLNLRAAAAAATLLVLLALAAFLAVQLAERWGRLPWRRGEVGT